MQQCERKTPYCTCEQIRVCLDIAQTNVVAGSASVLRNPERAPMALMQKSEAKSQVQMAHKALSANTPPTPLLNKFTSHVIRAKAPNEILNGLDEFASKLLPIHVLGVGRMPKRTSDWRSIQLGVDVFLHASVPVEWWNEYAANAAQGYDPGILMAKSSLVAYTWTETMQGLEPIGFDRWPYELAIKYGIRDALTCCVGQRWLVAYWSRQVLSNVLTHPLRILLIAAAGFAALRLEQVLGDDPRRFGNQPRITARELAVLRLASLGMGSSQIAKSLGIGEETVRSHLFRTNTRGRARAAQGPGRRHGLAGGRRRARAVRPQSERARARGAPRTAKNRRPSSTLAPTTDLLSGTSGLLNELASAPWPQSLGPAIWLGNCGGSTCRLLPGPRCRGAFRRRAPQACR